MKFNYQAKGEEGEIYAGQIEALSEEAAVALLQKQGLYITSLEEEIEEKEKNIFYKKIKISGKTSRKDVVLFSRQLSVMFRSKVPLIEALRTFSQQTPNPDFREKILRISKEVEGGTSFSKALALYPKVFSLFYVAMIKAGEASGKLSGVLDYLSEHMEREYHLTAKAKGALVYPALTLLVIIVVLIVITIFVIPQLTRVLEGMGRELPLITKMVIGFSTFFSTWWWLIILTIIAIIVINIKFYQTQKGKFFFHHLFLKIPVIGNVLKMIYVARFAENLSTLISGGLPITRALAVTGDIIDNVAYKVVILKTQEAVKKGETISSVLFNHLNLFPPVFVQMVLVGEKTGTLSTTLFSIVSFYQKEVDRTIDAALSLLEPVMILFLAVIVVVIVLAVLLPLYQGLGAM